MKLRLLALVLFFTNALFAQNFHDTQGKLDISSSGHAMYTLPVAMPPSINDVGPIVNLNYSSAQESGIAGQGWSINTISAITRIATRFDIEGYRDGVDFDINDKLALDGQRLLLKSGTYWADGSLYETEVQSNTKIELKKNGAAIYFIVTTPDGSRTWYGNYNSMDATDVTAFYAVRFEDAKGNFIDYVYAKPSNKGLCIKEIKFSGNTITNPTALNKIEFNYRTAVRKENAYAGGVKVEKADILNEIKVYTNGVVFRRYLLTHLADTQGYERVTKLQEYNGAGEAANPVEFAYNLTAEIINENTTLYEESLDLSESPKLSGDFDGDGRLDFVNDKKLHVKLFQGAGAVYDFPYSNSFLDKRLQFTATTLKDNKLNQKQSFVKVAEAIDMITFDVYNLESNGVQKTYSKTIPMDNSGTCSDVCTSFIEDENGNILNPQDSKCTSPTYVKNSNKYLEGDFNGDSISDVMILSFMGTKVYTQSPINPLQRTDGGCEWQTDVVSLKEVRIVDLNSSSPIADNTYGNYGLTTANIQLFQNTERYVMDFNSDGKSDVLLIDPYKNYKIVSFNQLTAAPWGELEVIGQGVLDDYKAKKQILFGDYNGDGKTDIMLPVSDGDCVPIYNGDNCLQVTSGECIPIYNGSNCPDTTDKWTIYYGNPNPAGGEFFVKETHVITEYIDKTPTGYPINIYKYYAMDINKDGKSDLVKILTRLSQPSTFFDPKDINSKWEIKAFVNNIGLNGGFNPYGIAPVFPNLHEDNNNSMPIVLAGGNYRHQGMDTDLLVVRYHGQGSFRKRVTYVDFTKDFTKDNLLVKVTQSGGSIVDEISYKPMEPETLTTELLGAPVDFYSSENTLQYPLLELKRLPTSMLVSKVKNTSLGVSKFQDYNYLGYMLDLNGLGALGFKKTAKSAWYVNGADKKIWDVTENNSSFRGALKKKYSQLITGDTFSFADTSLNLIHKVESTFTVTPDLVSKRYILLAYKNIGTDYLTNVITETVNEQYTADYFLPESVTTKKYLGTQLQGKSNTFTSYVPVGSSSFIGRPQEVTNTSWVYDTAGNVTDTQFGTEKFTYSGADLIKIEKNANNAAETIVEEFEYFTNGLLKSKKISATGTTAGNAVSARTTSYTYEPTNRFVKTITDIEGLVTTNNTYHSLYGLVLSQTNALGQITLNEYDHWGKRTKVTDFLGKSIVYAYTRSGNIYTTNETGDDGSGNIIESDALARVIRKGVKDFNGNWNYAATEYDYLGRKTRESEPYTTSANLWTVYEYDDYGRPVKVTQPTGNSVVTTYTGLTVSANDGVIIKSKTLNANGHVVSSTDTPGGTILFKYNAAGNLLESDYGGVKITTTYDKWGRRESLTDSSAGTYTTGYNAFGEVLKETTPKGSTTYVLNAVGKPVTKTVLGATSAEATNITNTYTYDPTYKWLTRIDVVNPNDGNSSYAYAYDTTTKQLKQTIETLPYATFTKNLTFDAFGRVNTEETIGTAHGKTSAKTIKYEYKNGAKWKMLDGTTMIWQANTANARGQITGASLGNGVAISNTYDQYGLPTQIKHEIGTTNPVNVMTLNNTFDVKRGNLTQRYTSLFDLTEKFEYDTLDRLVTWNGPNQNLLTLPFNTTTDGFTFTGTGTSGSVTNSAGTLKVVLKSPWVAAQRSLPTGFVANDIVNVKATITNKTGSSGVIVNAWIVETDPANAGNWMEYYVGPIENGSFDKNYTVSNYVSQNPLLTVKFVVDESSPEDSNGGGLVFPNSTFYVDNFKIEKASVVTQQYDDRGRITQNNTGTYNYTNSAKPYQNTSVTSVTTEEQAYYNSRGNLDISYNAFKAPVQIEELGKDKLSFAYNGMLGRSAMYYGSTATDKMSRPNRRYYSADGSMEINYNSGVVELVTYIGGDAYSAPIVLKSNGTTQNYFYLHRDYQGSILAVTNATGAIVEKRHFDAWGAIVKVQDGAGNNLTKLTFLDRGYTGHEHLQSVGLIHMNGRLYDPKLHRFLQPDNFVQDPYNTQNYNRYAYVLNNPFKYTDQNGEELVTAIVVGAVVGLVSYLTINMFSNQPITLMGAFKATFMGAVSGAVTFGIGSWTEGVKNFFLRAGYQALAHGTFQGTMSGIQGGGFWNGLASGALSSIASSAWGGGPTSDKTYTVGSHTATFTNQTVRGLGGNFAGSAFGKMAFGTIMGGAGAALTGGNFWKGAVTGLIVSGLNHVMHDAMDGGNQDPPSQRRKNWDTNGDGILQKGEADSWYLYGNGESITVDNSKIDWSGLKMPLKGNANFAISTADAFVDLPYETASTYGGTSFQRIDAKTAIVKDQLYHYELRPNNSFGNVIRNVMNELGRAGGTNYTREGRPPLTGKPFMIHYANPIIRF